MEENLHEVAATFTANFRCEDAPGVQVAAPADPRKGIQWLVRAWHAGDQEAVVDIAECLLNGHGLNKDTKKAFTLLLNAAAEKNPFAMRKLGHIYREGKHEDKNYEEAWQWYRKAAELGDTPAMLMLSAMYASGEGVARDNRASVEWLRRAAAAGDALARELLRKGG